MLYIYWLDKGGESRAGRIDLAARALDLLERNPVAPLTEMDFNLLDRWRPYDHAQALRILSHGSRPCVQLRDAAATEGPGAAVGAPCTISTMTRASDDIVEVSLRIDPRALSPDWIAGALFPYMRQITDLLPHFHHAYARADAFVGERRRALGLPELPKSLDYSVDWYYLLTPAQYERDYTRETLLAAPAVSVREPKPGWVELICYEDPLSFEQPATLQRIVELTRYLDTHRRAHTQP